MVKINRQLQCEVAEFIKNLKFTFTYFQLIIFPAALHLLYAPAWIILDIWYGCSTAVNRLRLYYSHL